MRYAARLVPVKGRVHPNGANLSVIVPPTAPLAMPGTATSTWLLPALCTRRTPLASATELPAICTVSSAAKPGAVAKLNVTTPPLAVADTTLWVLKPLTSAAVSTLIKLPAALVSWGAPTISWRNKIGKVIG